MKGAGEDPNKRRPFEWENVEGNELYAYYKEIIQLRKEHKAMSEGTFSAYDAKDDKLFAYELTSDDEKLLVIHNMARKEIPLDQSITEGKEIIYSENFDNNKLGSLSTIVIKE